MCEFLQRDSKNRIYIHSDIVVVFCVFQVNKWQSLRREVNDEVALNGMWRLLLVCLWTF